MDPDSEAGQTASQILRTSVITVVFTTCHYYKTETTVSSAKALLPLKVTVHETAKKPAVKKKAKTIYLTFDDGPNKGTKKMMHIVEEEEVPVTLFIIGEQVYGSREQTATFDSIVACKYFEIANHSFTHAFHNQFAKFYTLPDSAVKDFKRCADSLHLTANIIRMPGRNIWRTATITSTDIKNTAPAADSIHQQGFTEVGWDLEWHFDNALKLSNNSDELLQQIDSMFTHSRTKTPNHLVLLAHDQVYADSDDSSELHQLIIKLKARDEYNFEVLSNYPALKN
jgi:hypothetical protein